MTCCGQKAEKAAVFRQCAQRTGKKQGIFLLKWRKLKLGIAIYKKLEYLIENKALVSFCRRDPYRHR